MLFSILLQKGGQLHQEDELRTNSTRNDPTKGKRNHVIRSVASEIGMDNCTLGRYIKQAQAMDSRDLTIGY